MGNIHILSDLVVNKIAAGEVIERPASVVKELLENAVDAGASRIVVEIEDGGRKLIRVSDDGTGMSAEDLGLCVRAHATSKIRNEEDLFAVGSLGFRGEALPSIASISQMRVISRPHDAQAGHEIEAQGEELKGPRVAASPPGTRVEVRNLFFNVPARRKFLKGANTEIGHVVDQLARVALASPGIAFELMHNGRTMHRLEATDSLTGRIADFYGRELADSLMEISYGEGELSIRGYAAPPARARSAAKWQFSFVNGRFVRDRFIQHAVRESFRGLIEPTRFPVVFLWLRADPGAVDVNVHPTKIEVRWQESSRIHSAVLAALREVLLRSDLTPALEAEPAADESVRVRSEQVRQAIADFFKRQEPVQKKLEFGRGTTPTDLPPRPAYGAGPSGSSSASNDPPIRLPSGLPAAATEGAVESSAATPTRAIQLHNTYLVAETSDGMIIIDQHALHERVLYEQLNQRIAQGALETQRLLLPESVAVTQRQMALIEEHRDLLERLGLEVSPFGRGSVAIHSSPTILNEVDLAAFLCDLLDALSEKGRKAEPENVLESMIQMMACKAAVKAGDPLTAAESEALIEQRDVVEKSSNCPHGRPTTLRMTIADLERQFKRV